MTTKELTRCQTRWAKTLGRFDFKIILCPSRHSLKPDSLSCCPDLTPPKGVKLTFGQLLKPANVKPCTFAEVSDLDAWFIDESIEMEDVEHWFKVDVMGAEELSDPILNDSEIIQLI
jgi:hypothetical protein